MTTKQGIPAIGLTINVQCDFLEVECIVLDSKASYGKVRLEVTPVRGTGHQWVELSRCTPLHNTQWEFRNTERAQALSQPRCQWCESPLDGGHNPECLKFGNR